MQAQSEEARSLLAARGLEVNRGGTLVVPATDLELAPAELAWLGGPSGTGKTTLLLALARLLPCSRGDLSLGVLPSSRVAAPLWRSQVLYVPHPPLALGHTVEEDLLTPYELRTRRHQARPTREQLRRELDDLGLEEVGLAQAPEKLSQGQLARVALARAILARPRVLLLDEPTANLDAEAAKKVERRVVAYCHAGGAAVVASHSVPWEIATVRVQLARRNTEGVPT